MKEIIDLLKKYTDGKKNIEKVEVSVLNLNRIIKALEKTDVTDINVGDIISREETIKSIENMKRFQQDTDDICEMIQNLPSVTPQPKIGRWIKTPKAVMGDGYMWYCDKCEHQVYQDSSKPYPSEKYCPNCGVKMVGSQES